MEQVAAAEVVVDVVDFTDLVGVFTATETGLDDDDIAGVCVVDFAGVLHVDLDCVLVDFDGVLARDVDEGFADEVLSEFRES